ncbi:hypothetical protein GMOD_00010131 [Pyrenophora seminiperda CCB06]|uniref:Uncharacterized protein n=1 Tax=Pyrenophora seminiperda CCB06 TaxID=1302712 RepID=A0A3M7LZW3_9PLEO|nr:hypothetical protein GMOD_00010131 [Pyrenophora seminiperda CCB06]
MLHKRDLQRRHGNMSRDVVKSGNRHCRAEQLLAWTRQRHGCQDCRAHAPSEPVRHVSHQNII